MKEVIAIQVGGAGHRIGLSAWEQLLREHENKLFPEKYSDEEVRRRFSYCQDEEDGDYYKSVFREKEEGKFIPRTLFIDLEKASLNLSEVSDSTGENLLKLIQDHEKTCSEDQSLFVSEPLSSEGSSCYTFASGRNSQRSSKLLEISMERIRVLVEKCECNNFSFMIVSSIGGGMGSGFVSKLLEELTESYPKVFKYCISICPDVGEIGKEIEAVNSLLYIASCLESCDAKLFMENKAISKLCKKEFGLEQPSMDTLNELISLVMSNETLLYRFSSPQCFDIQCLSLNLPYPRIHNYYPSFAPIHPVMRTVPSGYGVEMFTHDSISCPFIETSVSENFMINCSLLYRGSWELRTINRVVREAVDKNVFKFCSWIQKSPKVGADHHRPLYSHNSNLLNIHTTVSILSNSTGFRSSLERIRIGTRGIFEKKSFLHHAQYEGMENDEVLNFLECYQELCMDYQEIHNYEELGPDENEED